jgi:hypothetical protein
MKSTDPVPRRPDYRIQVAKLSVEWDHLFKIRE